MDAHTCVCRREDRRSQRSTGTTGHVRLLHHVAGAGHRRPTAITFLHTYMKQTCRGQTLQLWRNKVHASHCLLSRLRCKNVTSGELLPTLHVPSLRTVPFSNSVTALDLPETHALLKLNCFLVLNERSGMESPSRIGGKLMDK